jgi:hypothetical protein
VTAARLGWAVLAWVGWRLARLAARLRCAWRGHEDLRTFRRRGVALACAECGRQTPGWDLSGPAPRTRYATHDRRRLSVGDPVRWCAGVKRKAARRTAIWRVS